MTSRPTQTSGLVYATDTHALLAVERVLSRSRRIAVLDVVHDQYALRHQLELADYDFVIIAVQEAGGRLPDIIRRFADLSVLVLTTSDDDSPLSSWLQQGASHVVRQGEHTALEHHVSQLIDAALARLNIENLQREVEQRDNLVSALFSGTDEPLLLWSANEPGRINRAAMELLSEEPSSGERYLQSDVGETPVWRLQGDTRNLADRNDVPELIPVSDYGPQRADDAVDRLPEPVRLDRLSAPVLASWMSRWLAPQYRSLLRDLQAGLPPPAEVLSRSGRRYRLTARNLGAGTSAEAWLLSFSSARKAVGLPALETDSTTGLPVRQSTAAIAQRYLDETPTSQRYTALLVSLPGIRVEDGGSDMDRTIEDLLVFRAASRLEALYDERTIVGRTSQRQLLVLSRDDKATSRRHARRIHRALGTLGGLVEQSESIRVDTLTLVGQSWTAMHVIERLEAIASVAESIPGAIDLSQTDEEIEPTLAMGTQTIV